MTHKEFKLLLKHADQAGIVCDIVQLGRGNYSNVKKKPDGSKIRVIRQSHYRRKYQVIINGDVKATYCRRISAKELIIDEFKKAAGDQADAIIHNLKNEICKPIAKVKKARKSLVTMPSLDL